jgi:hypothetical protein
VRRYIHQLNFTTGIIAAEYNPRCLSPRSTPLSFDRQLGFLWHAELLPRTRLAAPAPGLSIFGSRLISHDSAGWQITDAGRAFLLSLESPAPQIPEDVPMAAPLEAQLVPKLTEPMPSEEQRTTERAARGRSSSTLMRLIGNMRRRPRRTVAEGKRQAS